MLIVAVSWLLPEQYFWTQIRHLDSVRPGSATLGRLRANNLPPAARRSAVDLLPARQVAPPSEPTVAHPSAAQAQGTRGRGE
jgi:hypothetical protein